MDIAAVNDQLNRIDELCVPSIAKANELRTVLKQVYDSFTGASSKSYGPINELVVDNLDGESIWEEIQTRNRPLLRHVKKSLSVLSTIAMKRKKSGKGGEEDNEEGEEEEQEAVAVKANTKAKKSSKKSSSRGQRNDSDEEEEEVVQKKNRHENRQNNVEEMSSDDEDSDTMQADPDSEDCEAEDRIQTDSASEEEEEESSRHDAGYEEEQGHDGDDADFDFIDNMNEWLDAEEMRFMDREERLEKKEKKSLYMEAAEEDSDGEEEDEGDEDEEDFVRREMYEDDDDASVDGGEIKFDDFYVKESSKKAKAKAQDKSTKSDGNKKTSSGKLSMFGDDDDDESDFGGNAYGDSGEQESSGDEDDIDVHANSDLDASAQKNRSRFEKEAARHAREIANIEAEMIGPKKWEMKGEVFAKDRPANSLLESDISAEKVMRAMPVINEDHTATIEEMILKRVEDGRFDDVIPPEANTSLMASADAFILSQEKSRKGLGELYEEDEMKKNGIDADKVEEDDTIIEIKALFHKVTRQLDALAHFHYTPRPVVEDVKLSKLNVPSMQLEDINLVPENMFGETAAPEDIYKKKRGREGALMTEEEMKSEDKKRRRNATKAKMKKEKKEKQIVELAKAREGRSSKAYENRLTDEILKTDDRVISSKEDKFAKDYTNSTKFFTQLQEEAQQDIKASMNKSRKTKPDKKKSAGNSYKL